MLDIFAHRNVQPWPLLIFISGVLLCLRLFYIQFGPLGLGPDEAQYWDWSRLLDWSYVTKPPLTSWLLAATTSLLGDTLLGVRFFALLSQVCVPVLGFLIVQQLRDTATAWWAFTALTLTPIIALGGYVMTPDAPSMLCWFGALYLLVRLLNGQINPLYGWGLIGLIIGLGGLAKPTVALFYPCLGLYWLASRCYGHSHCQHGQQHTYVSLWGICAAGLISLLCQAPVMYWNATHDWLMFHHVLMQTTGDNRWQGLPSFFNFIVSQLLLVGPLVSLLMVARLHRLPMNLLWFFSMPLVGGFALLSFFTKVQGNWPVLGMSILIMLFSCHAATWPARYKNVLKVALAFNFMLILLLHNTDALRPWLPTKTDPTKTLRGWQPAGHALAEVAHSTHIATIITTRYQDTAQLAFNTPSQPRVYYLNPGWRPPKHYDFIHLPSPFPRQVLFATQRKTVPPIITATFGPCALQHTHTNPWRSLHIFLCKKEGHP